MIHARLAAAFDFYLDLVTWRKRARELCGRVLGRWLHRTQAASFATWRAAAVRRRRMCLLADRLEARRRAWALSQGFDLWLGHAETGRAARRVGGLEQACSELSAKLGHRTERLEELARQSVARRIQGHTAEAFRRLVEGVAESRRRRALDRRAQTRRELTGLGRAFEAFADAVSEHRALRDQDREVSRLEGQLQSEQRRSEELAQHLDALKQSLHARLDRQAASDETRAAFEGLRSATGRARRARQICRKALGKMRCRDLSQGLERWRSATSAARVRRQACTRAVKRWQAGLASRAYDKWAEEADKARSERLRQAQRDRRQLALCERVLRRMIHARLAAAFDFYLDLVTWRKRARELCGRVLGRWLHRTQAASFATWRAAAVRRRRMCLLADRLEARRRAWALSQGFDLWLGHAETGRAARRVGGLEQACSELSAKLGHRTERLEELARQSVARRIQGHTAEAFRRLVEGVAESRRRRALDRRAQTRRELTGLGRAFEAFADAVSEHRALRDQDREVSRLEGQLQSEQRRSEELAQHLDALKQSLHARLDRQAASDETRAAFEGLRSATGRARRARQICRKALGKMRCRDLSQGLERWRSATSAARVRRQACTRAVKRWQAGLASRAYDKWAEEADKARSERLRQAQRDRRQLALCERVLRRMIHARLAAAFDFYLDLVTWRKRARELCGRVLGRWLHRTQAASFATWRAAAVRRRRMCLLADRLEARRRAWALSQGFDLWLGHAETGRAARRVGGLEQACSELSAKLGHRTERLEELARQSVARRIQGHTAEAFRRLVEGVAESRRRRALDRRAQTRRELTGLGRAFEAFADAVSEHRALRDQDREVSRLEGQLQSEQRRSEELAQHLDALKQSLHARLDRQAASDETRAAFEGLRSATGRARRARQICRKALGKMRCRDLSQGLERWRSATSAARVRRQACTRAVKRWQAGLASRAYDKWAEEADKARSERLRQAQRDRRQLALCERVLRRMIHARLAAAFDFYLDLVTWRKRARELCGRVLGRWLHRTQAASFATWRAAAVRRRRMCLLADRLEARRRAWALSQGFDLWLGHAETGRAARRVGGLEQACSELSAKLGHRTERLEELARQSVARRIQGHTAEAFRRLVEGVAESPMGSGRFVVSFNLNGINTRCIQLSIDGHHGMRNRFIRIVVMRVGLGNLPQQSV
ncbi:hypothetical protein GUITHDRAFT_114742 [Guillardia theta CCMP2712]|uniref:Sfi1 spindle body domain-containing protein n=1 Tax=Guillardia theta (strain CCMP2712) TaxID=905079 RepID=L1IS40_GUITC|nr:hypothetical protein GUITHDRAFT_114742 [Guillardia theta CCMP2712]EKX39086.1 hypothetical protein GUITHDRAFT_114742 [Guillardia theta CCMP2712]|eukprot:XP_005826066.1 hypothetical protein GUITHDRAFT_114742 [Guillardia theta CCMP2712]